MIRIIHLSLNKKFEAKKNFFTIKYPTDFLLKKIVLIFNNFNKNITFHNVKNIGKDDLIKENDLVYKNRKFPYYEPKKNLITWIKKR